MRKQQSKHDSGKRNSDFTNSDYWGFYAHNDRLLTSNLHYSEKALVKDHRIYKLQKLRRKVIGDNQDEMKIKISVFDFRVTVLHRSEPSIDFVNLL